MADVLYVGLQDGDKILTFTIDSGSGAAALVAETPAAGAPSAFAVSLDRRVLYVGYRGSPGIESHRIDPASGALTSLGRVAGEHPVTYLATDRAGKYLLSAYYQGGYAAVHALGTDGAVRGPAVDRQDTAPGAHAILTDPSNRFAFVPHIAR
jgi:6-phosphogluconolactonase (cycloisomerase 2 family)